MKTIRQEPYNNIIALTFNSAGSETVEINDLPYGLNYTVKRNLQRQRL